MVLIWEYLERKTPTMLLLLVDKKIKILLYGALLFGLFLRVFSLIKLPFPPDGDEVAFGYYGWSLGHFASDEYSRVLPLNFPSIGDFKYPGMAYLNIIPAIFFGLNDITTRIVSALSGTFLILVVFNLAKLIFKNVFVSVASAWFIALSPWGIIESRLGYETMSATFLVTLAVYILLKLLNSKKIKRKYLSWLSIFLLLVLASFTYAAARVFIPLILLTLVLFTFIKNSVFEKNKKGIRVLFLSISAIVVLSVIPVANRGRASEDLLKVTPSQLDRLQQIYVQAGSSKIKT